MIKKIQMLVLSRCSSSEEFFFKCQGSANTLLIEANHTPPLVSLNQMKTQHLMAVLTIPVEKSIVLHNKNFSVVDYRPGLEMPFTVDGTL